MKNIKEKEEREDNVDLTWSTFIDLDASHGDMKFITRYSSSSYHIELFNAHINSFRSTRALNCTARTLVMSK